MRRTMRGLVLAGAASTTVLTAGCSTSPELTGMWQSTGLSPMVSFFEDGTCSGLMSVDIGGPMYCSLGESSGGGYVLRIQQGENYATYLLEPDGSDHLDVLSSNGSPAFTLDRL
ncbi:hypothetical protein [Rhodococcus phenolicus]|uniref:hypothetical protein n=1 Tax=Rhodococcus phenolicus TaxID=263849 RepID=UPI000AF1C45D|nr:hypothetical protein [Rhodococcus phenolicus]